MRQPCRAWRLNVTSLPNKGQKRHLLDRLILRKPRRLSAGVLRATKRVDVASEAVDGYDDGELLDT